MPWKVPVNENGGDSNGNWPGGGGKGESAGEDGYVQVCRVFKRNVQSFKYCEITKTTSSNGNALQ